jgi:DNA-directed RNA polymerase sigma subunit (sigma70/sigma32)
MDFTMDQPLAKYLEEARAAELVFENESALLELARAGDVEARHTLVRAYLSRTAKIGLRLAPEGMADLDAVQEANFVLLRLVTKAPEPNIAHHRESVVRNHLGPLMKGLICQQTVG